MSAGPSFQRLQGNPARGTSTRGRQQTAAEGGVVLDPVLEGDLAVQSAGQYHPVRVLPQQLVPQPFGPVWPARSAGRTLIR